jgi:hypothetical protein
MSVEEFARANDAQLSRAVALLGAYAPQDELAPAA